MIEKIGDIRRGAEIGKKYSGYYVWVACEICGKERWVQYVKSKAVNKRCQKCESLGRKQSPETRVKIGLSARERCGEKASNWKGGRQKNGKGYVLVWIKPDDFFVSMARKKTRFGAYVLEHRLVVAKALGRCLLPWEVVHHRTGFAKDDNRYPETLELITDKRFHMVDMQVQRYIRSLEERIERLEASREH